MVNEYLGAAVGGETQAKGRRMWCPLFSPSAVTMKGMSLGRSELERALGFIRAHALVLRVSNKDPEKESVLPKVTHTMDAQLGKRLQLPRTGK